MSKALWDELSNKWPVAYWDDWLREPAQRKGRHTIRPEVCRTFHFGKVGVSAGQYSEYLNNIELNSDFVSFTELSLDYLTVDNWDKLYLQDVQHALLITKDNFETKRRNLVASGQTVDNIQFKIEYTSLDGYEPTSFVNIAHWAKCMDNIKANVPRTAYHGIVSLYVDGIRLHIVPK